MGRLIEAAVAGVQAHRGRWALAGLLVMALGVWGLTRIQLEDDARSMIASAHPDVAEALQALSDFTAVDQMLIHVDARALFEKAEGAGSNDALLGAARLVESTLRASGQFDEVRWQASPQEQLDLALALVPRRLLVDPQPPEQTFTPEALRAHLTRTREMLLTPQGIVQKEVLLADPVGSLSRVLTPLANAPGLSKLDASGGTFYSVDGTSILMLAAPKGDPFGGDDARRTMAAIAAARTAVDRAHPGVVLRPIGAHRYQEDAQSMVMWDVHLSAAMTLLIIVAIFAAFFRRLRLTLIALPPLAFGVCVAAGVAGLWARPIHGIVLAFSGACLGLSIDYTIHLLAALQDTDAPTPAQALPLAARRVGGSLALAAATTAGGLGTLALSSVDALRQMAVLSVAAVIGAFAGNLLWVPVLLPILGKDPVRVGTQRGPWGWTISLAGRRPGWVLATLLALAGFALVQARGTRLDGDLSNLDTHTDEAQADEAAFARTFGDPTTTALLLASGADLDGALERAHAGAELLRTAGVTRLLSPSAVAPPRSVLEARKRAWCADPARWVSALDAAAVEVGFRAGAFARFEQDLTAMCASPVPDPDPPLEALGTLLGRPLYRSGDGAVRVPVAFEAPAATLQSLGLEPQPGMKVLHAKGLTGRMVSIMAQDLPRLGGFALALTVALLLLAFRNLRQPLRALGPCLWGASITLGVFAATGTPINLMNLCLFPLLCGLGIDYGILMADVEHDPRPEALRERAFSVTVAAATTCAGFGTLAIARYYAIATIGQSVLLAVVSCALAALFIPEALRQLALRRRTEAP